MALKPLLWLECNVIGLYQIEVSRAKQWQSDSDITASNVLHNLKNRLALIHALVIIIPT